MILKIAVIILHIVCLGGDWIAAVLLYIYTLSKLGGFFFLYFEVKKTVNNSNGLIGVCCKRIHSYVNTINRQKGKLTTILD